MTQQDKTLNAFLTSEKMTGLFAICAIFLSIILSFSEEWHAIVTTGMGGKSLAYLSAHYLFPLFFFLVTLEAKREASSVRGHLYGKKKYPILFMALFGVIGPMVIYYLLTGKIDPRAGIFIPIATDIAFVVLAGSKAQISQELRITLLAIAVVDDILGIAILAYFFEDWNITKIMFIVCVICIVILANKFESFIDKFLLSRSPITWMIIFGVLLFSFDQMHIHTSLAGVITALLVPYKKGSLRLEKSSNLKDSVFHWLEERTLSVLCAWLIVPIFIVTNVVIPFHQISISNFTSITTIAIAASLVLGKSIGITALMIFMQSIFDLKVPAKNMKEFIGGAFLCGIGFSVALFFAGQSTMVPQMDAFIGISLGSIISAIIGIYLIRTS